MGLNDKDKVFTYSNAIYNYIADNTLLSKSLLENNMSTDHVLKFGPYYLKWVDKDDYASGKFYTTLGNDTTVIIVSAYISGNTWIAKAYLPHNIFGLSHNIVSTSRPSLSEALDNLWNMLQVISDKYMFFNKGLDWEVAHLLVDKLGDKCPDCEVFWGSNHRSDCGYTFLEKKVQAGDFEYTIRDWILLKKDDKS